MFEYLLYLESLWTDVIKAVFDKYESFGRPILDVLYILFNNTFNIFLVLTVIISALFMLMTIYNIFAKKKHEKLDFNYYPRVTVQIPTFNELVALRCASACLDFDYPKDKYEIFIGDDSNKPEISQKLAGFAEKHDIVRVIKRENNAGFKPGNLNNMLKYSNGEIIVIFDSDFAPERDFLKRIVQPFASDERIAAVQARWSFINNNQNLVSLLASTILNVYHYITLPFVKNIRELSFLCGSAEAVRKDVLLKLGAWDSGNLTEDIEYSIRMLNNGYKTFYLPELSCDSEVPYYPLDLYKQQMRWAHGVIYSLKKHFASTFFNSLTSFSDKLCVLIVVGGYFLATCLMALFGFGILSLVTHPPAPINFTEFFRETGRNILITSGLLFASIVATIQSKNSRKLFPMLASSFSYGIITTYYVNKGIFKAIIGRPMHWYMLNKKGNESI